MVVLFHGVLHNVHFYYLTDTDCDYILKLFQSIHPVQRPLCSFWKELRCTAVFAIRTLRMLLLLRRIIGCAAKTTTGAFIPGLRTRGEEGGGTVHFHIVLHANIQSPVQKKNHCCLIMVPTPRQRRRNIKIKLLITLFTFCIMLYASTNVRTGIVRCVQISEWVSVDTMSAIICAMWAARANVPAWPLWKGNGITLTATTLFFSYKNIRLKSREN